MKFTIRRKLLFLLIIIGVTYSLAVAFILLNFKDQLTEDARQITITKLRENASNAENIINGDFEIVRTLASTLSATLDYETSIREKVTGELLASATALNPRYLSTWVSLELSAIDPSWTKTHGRKRYTYYQIGEPVLDSVNLDGDIPGSLYFALKQSKKEELTEPYLLSETSDMKDDRNEFMGTSVCVPLLKDGKFAGLAGIDITLESLNFVTGASSYKGASSFLVSNQGVIVAHVDRKLVGKSITSIIHNDTTKLLADIKAGTANSWVSPDHIQLFAFTPLKTTKKGHYWSIGTTVPMKAMTAAINPILLRTIGISAIGLVILLISIRFISKAIADPINDVNERMKDLAHGIISKGRDKISNDEIGEMINSLNLLSENMQKKIDFAVQIGNGQFDTEFSVASKDDILGNVLMRMQQNLRQFRDQDEKRTWLNEGLTKLNEVIRLQNDTEEHHLKILKTIITFLHANQGALFVAQDDLESEDKHIDLVAAYAYGRKKHITQRLGWGENLIGQCMLEKEMIYLKEIPKGYIKITSGLGEAVPSVLVIAPLKVDTQVVGAIELAMFKELREHEITFVQKACEVVASWIHLNRVRSQSQLWQPYQN